MLNVPMQPVQPVLSLSDAVGKWTQINNQQAEGQLAQQQETRLADQNQRENKMGELKFNITQQAGLKDAMTSYKSALQSQAAKLGVQPNTPQYQQLANATYHNGGYDKLVQNMGGHPHDPKTDIDLSAVDVVAGMTPSEQNAAELQNKKAELDLAQPYKMELARETAGLAQQGREQGYQHDVMMKDIDYQYRDARDERKYHDDELERMKGEGRTGRKPLTEYQAAQLQEKHDKIESEAADALNGIKTTRAELEKLKGLQDDVATGSIIGSDLAVGVRKMLPNSIGQGDKLAALQKGYAEASLKAIGALKAGGTTLGAMSDKEGEWVRNAEASLNATGTVNKAILDKGIELLNEREKTINGTVGMHRKTLDRLMSGEFQQQAQTQPQRQAPEKPEGVTDEEWNAYLKETE